MKKFYIFFSFFIIGATLFAQDADSLALAKQDSPANLKNSNEIRDFRIYPNPVVDGKLYINTFYNTEKSIQIFDILGKQVFATTLKTRELDLSKLHPGVYILKALEAGRTATRKLVIK